MKTYIHVGYPKNASTTLQTDIFPNIKGAFYLGRLYGSDQPFISKEISDVIHSISTQDSIDFSPHSIEAKISPLLYEISKQNDKLIISSESFANNVADRGLMAERLNKIFPDAKILVVIRNQMDALQSMYAFLVCQMGKNINISYGRPSVESFEKWLLEQEAFISRSYITTLKYYEYVSEYWRLFGKDNVTVLLFEDLVNSPASFFGKLAQFFDVDRINYASTAPLTSRNKRPTKRRLVYQKLRGGMLAISPSRFLPGAAISWARDFLDSEKASRGDEKLPSEIRERVLNIYKEGNRNLQEELGIDLARHGYLI